MKMNNYALPEGEIRISGDMTGMGAHTDFGILTILWADQVPGLQVLSADGVWHDVQPADGALLINLGNDTAHGYTPTYVALFSDKIQTMTCDVKWTQGIAL
jgi:hypothetical protein